MGFPIARNRNTAPSIVPASKRVPSGTVIPGNDAVPAFDIEEKFPFGRMPKRMGKRIAGMTPGVTETTVPAPRMPIARR